jgi:CBS domain-containing membrane protein
MWSKVVRGVSWLKSWLGVELDPVSAREKGISALGGLLAILLVTLIASAVLGSVGGPMVIASMGASAVLLFAVPHGQLSQPWPVLAGHGASAAIGVFCARHIAVPELAAACAVAISVAVMHQGKCIHPPGGATALTAVIGGDQVHALGYSFIWQPVLLNALLMVAVAVAFNSLFRWRRYPAFWHERPKPQPGDREISHEEVVAALESFDSFVDITEDDLIRLHQLLSRRVPPKTRTEKTAVPVVSVG